MKREDFLATLTMPFSAFLINDWLKCQISTNKICHKCKYKLGKNIFMAKGVKAVEVDELNRSIMITYDASKTSLEKLKKYIVSIGFDANELKADINKRELLLDCCFTNFAICR